jgi:tRNA-specific adenosine deaminase 2
MHDLFLKQAYDQALLAYQKHEVPVGCIVVRNKVVISRSHNMTNLLHTPLAHAELNALRQLSRDTSDSLVFYITCEPCVMCLGILSRLKCTFYYGCKNERFGGSSVLESSEKDWLVNLKDPKCYEILREFYKRENINAPEELRKKK